MISIGIINQIIIKCDLLFLIIIYEFIIVVMKYCFLFVLSFNTYITHTQCLITKTEYDHIIKDLDDVDPIVGLWHLSGMTYQYQGDSLLSVIMSQD